MTISSFKVMTILYLWERGNSRKILKKSWKRPGIWYQKMSGHPVIITLRNKINQ